MEIKQPHILIIDDEPINLEIMEDYLDELNYQIICRDNGKDAWDYLKNHPHHIDVILLDRMMPGMDGLTLLKKIRAHDQLKSIPVILQTALISEKDVVEGMRAGAYYYLTKPFSEEMLRSVLKTALHDRTQFVFLQNQLKEQKNILGLMQSAEFYFKTLEDVNTLSLLIANACPNSEDVVSGLAEIMINSVEHGNLGITYAEKSALIKTSNWRQEIQKRLQMDKYKNNSGHIYFKRNEHDIKIVISDSGDGFNWQKFIEFDSNRILDSHGRGIAMAKKFSFADLTFNQSGNCVTLQIQL